jgi:hypothetical protein
LLWLLLLQYSSAENISLYRKGECQIFKIV